MSIRGQIMQKNIAWIVVCILGIAILHMPYGYYTFLRISLFIIFCITARNDYQKSKLSTQFLISCGFAILYNPIFIVGFPRYVWFPINILTILCVYRLYIKKNN